MADTATRRRGRTPASAPRFPPASAALVPDAAPAVRARAVFVIDPDNATATSAVQSPRSRVAHLLPRSRPRADAPRFDFAGTVATGRSAEPRGPRALARLQRARRTSPLRGFAEALKAFNQNSSGKALKFPPQIQGRLRPERREGPLCRTEARRGEETLRVQGELIMAGPKPPTKKVVKAAGALKGDEPFADGDQKRRVHHRLQAQASAGRHDHALLQAADDDRRR